jgi:xanthine phosphoribosyltransferase
MDLLKQAILEKAKVINSTILNLDQVLNHQVDPQLMMKVGEEFASRYKESGVTKILTVESSGISVAFATAYHLGVPFVFARRKKTLMTDADSYCERVPSFTKGIVTDIVLPKVLISSSDTVLLIDDIIANGDAAKGLMRIVEQSGAKLAGWGIVVEKGFQRGAEEIRESGVRVESLVRIESLEGGTVHFA